MNASEIDALAGILPMDEVEVVAAPKTGLIMANVRDCFRTEFHLGEVLVTRAEVVYRGQRAQATLLGDCPQAALVAAVLEAVCLNGRADLLESAGLACAAAEARIAAQETLQTRLVTATRVNFQSMAEEA